MFIFVRQLARPTNTNFVTLIQTEEKIFVTAGREWTEIGSVLVIDRKSLEIGSVLDEEFAGLKVEVQMYKKFTSLFGILRRGND